MRILSSAPVGFCIIGGYVGDAIACALQPRVRVSLEAIGENAIVLAAPDQRLEKRLAWQPVLSLRHELPLPAAIFNAVHRHFGVPLSAFYLSYQWPGGVALTPGTACAAAVAMVQAFAVWLRLPMSQVERACMAAEAVAILGLPLPQAYPLCYAAALGGVLLLKPGQPAPAVEPILLTNAMRMQLDAAMMLWEIPATGDKEAGFSNLLPKADAADTSSLLAALVKERVEDVADALRPLQYQVESVPKAPGWQQNMPVPAWRTDHAGAPALLLSLPEDIRRSALTAHMNTFGARRLAEGLALSGAEAAIC